MDPNEQLGPWDVHGGVEWSQLVDARRLFAEPRPPVPLLALAALLAAGPAVPQEQTPRSATAVERARLIEFHASDYPPGALFRGEEAEIAVILQVGLDGRVTSVVSEAPKKDLQWFLYAKPALLKFRFAPARVDGRAATATVPFTYRFAVGRPAAEPGIDVLHTSTIHGEVLSGGQRLPVPGVEVVAQGLGTAATTDAKGRFSLSLPPGEHVLVVFAPNFFALQSKVELPEGHDAEVTLYPRRKEVGDLQATIPGERVRTSPSRQTMVHEELRNVPGSKSDPIRVIENLPGLARAPFSGGQLIVRGARANDTGAYIDGQKIPILYHLLSGPSVLGVDMVDRIDFLPGGADVYYGRSLAGIVAVNSKRGDPDRLHGSLTTDLNKSSAFLQGPIGEKTQFAVGARRSYVNPIISFMTDESKQLTLPVYWDYQARADHELANGDRLSLLLYGSDDSYTLVGQGGGTVPLLNGLHIGFHRAKLTWERKIGEDWSIFASPLIGFDVNEHEQQGAGSGALSAAQAEREHTLAWGFRGEAFWRASPALNVRFGADVLFDRVSYQFDQLYSSNLRSVGAPNAEQAVRDGVRHLGLFGEYLEAEFRWGPLRLTPGLRFEQMHWTGHTYYLAEPRVWARLALGAATTLHAYAGVYHEHPTAQALDSLQGNPGLTPERADQYGLGITQKFGPLWTVKLEGYYNHRRSLVFPAEARARGDGTFDNPLQLNSGIGESIGLEVLIRRELSAQLYGWIAYTLSKSREGTAPGEEWTPTPFDQPHVLTALVGWRPSPQVEFAMRLRFASGNPYSPVLGATFDADSGSFVPARLGFGAQRLPPFVQLDFQINNIWSADSYAISLYLDFQNLLNRRNPEYLVYDYRFTRNDAVHGLPFLASIGAKVSF